MNATEQLLAPPDNEATVPSVRPVSTDTEEQVHQGALPAEKFDHSQAFLPWFWRNRKPGLQKLIKARKLGAFAAATAAVTVDYLGTNIVDTDRYSKHASMIEAIELPPDDGIERAEAATQVVRNLGFTALSEVVSYPSGLAAIVGNSVNLIKAGRNGPGSKVKTRQQEHEAVTRRKPEQGNGNREFMAALEAYNQRFQDPTYVPTAEEFREMKSVADRIHMVSPQPYEGSGIYYQVDGIESGGINPVAARSFLDAVQAKRWELTEEDADMVDRTLRVTTLPGLTAVQHGRRRENKNDLLNYDEYWAKHKPNGARPDVLEMYQNYLRQRQDLDRFVRDMEAE